MAVTLLPHSGHNTPMPAPGPSQLPSHLHQGGQDKCRFSPDAEDTADSKPASRKKQRAH